MKCVFYCRYYHNVLCLVLYGPSLVLFLQAILLLIVEIS
jgi:hypothetical protein